MDLPKRADDKPFKLRLEPGIVYKWCTCGLSQTQPFCDHSHRNVITDMKSLRFSVEKSDDYFLCMCKQSKNAPFCDGSHNKRN